MAVVGTGWTLRSNLSALYVYSYIRFDGTWSRDLLVSFER